MPALFEPSDDGFVANPIARGPWDDRMMYGGAPTALLAREIERMAPGPEAMVVARLTVDFLGAVPLGPVQVGTEVVKPGRRFQLVEATFDAGGRRACLARAVRVRRAAIPAAAATPARGSNPLPPPGDGSALPRFAAYDGGGFLPAACEIRHVSGEVGSGAVAAWTRLHADVVAGEAPSPIARVAAAADYANGLSWVVPFDEWLFINTDLTIHLHREPEGEWIGLDARTSTSEVGVGQSWAILHDVHGPIGHCAQSLLVEPR